MQPSNLPDSFEVLDPAQLRRIESVHKGFLYQHLYGKRPLSTVLTLRL